MPEYNVSNIVSWSALRSAYFDYGAERLDVRRTISRASFRTDDLDFIMMSDFELDSKLYAAMSAGIS